MSSDFITILTSAAGKILTKRHTPTGDGLKKRKKLMPLERERRRLLGIQLVDFL